MSNFSKPYETRITEAIKAYESGKELNMAKLAREWAIPKSTLHNRIKNKTQPRTSQKPTNYALSKFQEEALTRWIIQMNDLNMPVTPNLLKDWADQALRRTNPEALGVGKNWPYRFMKRLPKELNLRPVKQKVKEDKRIQAKDSGLLAH
jgi:hypothetical protein